LVDSAQRLDGITDVRTRSFHLAAAAEASLVAGAEADALLHQLDDATDRTDSARSAAAVRLRSLERWAHGDDSSDGFARSVALARESGNELELGLALTALRRVAPSMVDAAELDALVDRLGLRSTPLVLRGRSAVATPRGR
jgi:hypothetical protein